MSDPIERVREILEQVGYATVTEDWDNVFDLLNELAEKYSAALDCLEALRGPQWTCPDCGYVSPFHWEAKLHANKEDHLPVPDAYAEAWETFEEAIGE